MSNPLLRLHKLNTVKNYRLLICISPASRLTIKHITYFTDFYFSQSLKLLIYSKGLKMKHLILSLSLILMTSFALIASPSTAEAKNKFGAIAISPSSKAMGWSYNYNSKWKANQVALNKCYKYASDCKIAVWFRNACGAVAVGANGGWGAHWGHSVKNAKWKAKKTCRKYDSYCQVKRWVCTDR